MGSADVGLTRDGFEVGGVRPRTRPLQAKRPGRMDFGILIQGQAVVVLWYEEMDEVGKRT